MSEDSEARKRYLARQARYNTSPKGRARNARYEEKHPERAVRWEAGRHYGRRNPEGRQQAA